MEVLRNYHQFNDWTVFYFLRDGLTFGCKMANADYIFTADPENVEYILKTNFENYPKVSPLNLLHSHSCKVENGGYGVGVMDFLDSPSSGSMFFTRFAI